MHSVCVILLVCLSLSLLPLSSIDTVMRLAVLQHRRFEAVQRFKELRLTAVVTAAAAVAAAVAAATVAMKMEPQYFCHMKHDAAA